MKVTRTLGFTLRCVLCLGALVITTPARAIVPEHTVVIGAVHLKGVSPDNPVIYDNDWWFDVFDNNYLWAQASLGHTRVRGNIVSRDMWDWEKGYLYKMEDSVKDAEKALKLARDSGLKNLPDLTLDEVKSGAPGNVLDIQKAATDLKASREEFFRVMTDPALFP